MFLGGGDDEFRGGAADDHVFAGPGDDQVWTFRGRDEYADTDGPARGPFGGKDQVRLGLGKDGAITHSEAPSTIFGGKGPNIFRLRGPDDDEPNRILVDNRAGVATVDGAS